jgi:hypothetical protein
MRKYPIVYKVVAEPTIFMDAKFRRSVRYFCSLTRAERWGTMFLRKNPNGEALVLTKKRRGT